MTVVELLLVTLQLCTDSTGSVSGTSDVEEAWSGRNYCAVQVSALEVEEKRQKITLCSLLKSIEVI